MHATFDGQGGRCLALHMPLADFLSTGMIQQQARLNLCTSTDLVADRLPPGTDHGDDDELEQAVAEACEAASDYAVSAVRLESSDLLFARQRLCPDHGLRLVPAGDPQLVA